MLTNEEAGGGLHPETGPTDAVLFLIIWSCLSTVSANLWEQITREPMPCLQIPAACDLSPVHIRFKAVFTLTFLTALLPSPRIRHPLTEEICNDMSS